jgi:hypothetical protein
MIEIPRSHQSKPLVQSWTYRDRDGAVLGHIGRYQNGSDKKNIIPYFKLNGAGWTAGIELEPRPLYGLNKLANHDRKKAVFVVEGEKCAAALQSLGISCVTSLGGSQAAKLADWTPLSGCKLTYLLPDNDAPGEHYAMDVYAALMALEQPPAVKILRFNELPAGADIVNWLQGWVSNWDGYKPIADNLHETLQGKLRIELRKAEPVPDDWKKTDVGGSDLGGFDWETPGEIETKTPPVQALKPEMIPEPLRPWLTDVSHRMQTPTDFAAISALIIAGSVIGAACGIRPKRLDDWEVIPNLWGACIGRPSIALKSPAMKEPMQLLERLQAIYGEQFEREKAGAEFDTLANKAMLDDLKAQLAKTAKGAGKDRVASPDELQKIKADYLELTENSEPEPARRLFKTNECSIQSMTVLQKQNPRGLLTFRDELTGLLVKWDREDGADERAYFLEGWNGNGSFIDVKIGRGLTDAPNICISLLGGIQPDKLKRYLYQALQGNDDGLMQRLQMAVWPDEPKSWANVDACPNKVAKQRAFNILQALAELDFTSYGAVQGEHDERPFFHFDDEGQAIFNTWLAELQTVKIKNEDNPLMLEHLGKYRSLMPSLALIFHCIDIAAGNGSGQVSGKAARLAVDWCQYLETHARRIYAMAESPEHRAAVRLADKIREKVLPNPFTSKIVYHKGWHGLQNKQEVDAACNILIDENWLRMTRTMTNPSKGRPLIQYHINPVFL